MATRRPANETGDGPGAADASESRTATGVGGHDPRFSSDTAAGPQPVNRRKSKKAADAERRERHREAEARLEAERAQRRADNRAARERDAAERAARLRDAEAAQERARQEEEFAPRARAAASAGTSVGDEVARRRAEEGRQAELARKAAARERKRVAEAERRAARAERARQEAVRRAEERRAREEERRAEREADHARTRGADPYAILGIAPDATADEIARAYRRLARAHHPDLNRDGTPHEQAAREAQMKRVNVAYGLLGDPQRRKAYDRQRRRS